MRLSGRSGLEMAMNSKPAILSFLNMYSVYLFKKEPLFRKSISNDYNLNFIDGFFPSLYLSLVNFRKVSRTRGPTFTRKFLENKGFNKKILFVGNSTEEDLDFISKKFKINRAKLFSYNSLPYIAPKVEFLKRDIDKLVNYIKSKKPDFVFVWVGNPRQEILSDQLFKRYKTTYFNVGAAVDFVLEKKPESPAFFGRIGLEWLYRLLTDFKYSRKKVEDSFKGLFYLRKVKLR